MNFAKGCVFFPVFLCFTRLLQPHYLYLSRQLYETAEENFSDNPNTNLRIENEILKFKMQAERGAISVKAMKISPEIEAEFLKNAQLFDSLIKLSR